MGICIDNKSYLKESHAYLLPSVRDKLLITLCLEIPCMLCTVMYVVTSGHHITKFYNIKFFGHEITNFNAPQKPTFFRKKLV